MAKIKYNKEILKKTQREVGSLTFDEIGAVLDISPSEAERIFNKAMKKLGSPKMAREIYNYDKIGDIAEY